MCDGYQSPPLFAQCQCLISQVKTLGSFQIMIITISVLLLQISFEIYILKTPPPMAHNTNLGNRLRSYLLYTKLLIG